MRELHVIAVSEDGRHVLLAGKRGATQGGFRVALDDRLAAAVRGDLRPPGSDAPPASDLSPKEIQARLRTGESPESIAVAAGVPVARVQRFSGPVQGEMVRVIDACRSAFVVRGRLGPSAVPLGAAVDAALADLPGGSEDTVEWTTYRTEDGSWLVTVTWFARRRSRSASWRYDPSAKGVRSAMPSQPAVTATSAAAAALAHVKAQAPPRRPAAAATTSPAKKAPAKKAPAKKAPARTSPVKKASAKKAPAKKAPAKKAPVGEAPAKTAPVQKAARRKAAVTKPAASKAAVTKAPATKAPATKAALRKAPVKKVPVPRAPAPKAARKAPAKPTKAARLRVVPDPAPARTREPVAGDKAKTRAAVPAWADVLLGTAPGGDR